MNSLLKSLRSKITLIKIFVLQIYNKLTEVIGSKNRLHGMSFQMLRSWRIHWITIFTQIKIVTNQTFVSNSTKIRTHTIITAHTFNCLLMLYKLYKIYKYIKVFIVAVVI